MCESLRTVQGWNISLSQTTILLSFPPEAIYFPSQFHLKLQISLLCPSSLTMKESFRRASCCTIDLSLDPELKMPPFHASAATLSLWPSKQRILLLSITSQRLILPEKFPIASFVPCADFPRGMHLSIHGEAEEIGAHLKPRDRRHGVASLSLHKLRKLLEC